MDDSGISRLSFSSLIYMGDSGYSPYTFYYQANSDSPLFKELAAIFHKTNDVAGVLRDAIMPLGDRVAAAFIYSPNRPDNKVDKLDINLFVIGSVSVDEVTSAMDEAREQLGAAIYPEVMRANEFSTRMEHGDPFITGVMNCSTRFIKGFT